MTWTAGTQPDLRFWPDVEKRSTASRENFSRKGASFTNQAAFLTTAKAQLSSIYLNAGDIVTNINWAAGSTAPTVTHSFAGLYDSSLNVIRQSTDTLTVALTQSAINAIILDSIPVTAGARVASTTVTLTFPTLSQALTSLIAVNDSVVVSNANIAAYNGTFTVVTVTATQITYVSGGSATDSLAAPFPTVQLASGKRTFTVPTSGLYYGGMAQVGTVNSFLCQGGVGTNVLTGLAPITVGHDNTNTLTGTLVSPAAALTSDAQDAYFFIT